MDLTDFLTIQVLVPLWVLLLMVIGMLPLLFRVLGWLKGKGLVKDKEIIITTPMKSIVPNKPKEEKKKDKRINEVKILKLLAVKGDQGMLLQSIADFLKIDSNATTHALKYLEEKNMLEMVNAMGGDKYFLSSAGKKYCTKKGYLKSAA